MAVKLTLVGPDHGDIGALIMAALSLNFKVDGVEKIEEKPSSAPFVLKAEATVSKHDNRFAALLLLAKGDQLRVLREIKSRPEGVTAIQLGQVLGKSTSSVTGVLGPGLLRNVPKAGYQAEEVIVTKTQPDGSKVYIPGPALLAGQLPDA